MVRAPSASSRNSSETERESPNATDPYARDASARRRLLDGIRPAFGAEELSRRHASEIVLNWPCACAAARVHANCSVVSDPRQTITATPAVTRHQYQITAHFAERSDGHIADR
jgi:hypothetical protein